MLTKNPGTGATLNKSFIMGITSRDVELLELTLTKKKIRKVIELGSQNLYVPGVDPQKPPFAREWYEKKGIHYLSIDLAGDDGALKVNLAKEIPTEPIYDLVTDFGTSEHVVDTPHAPTAFHQGHINSVYPTRNPTDEEIAIGYYNCWKNKHGLCRQGGFILSVNPKTGNWPGHGYTYLDMAFYVSLATHQNYYIHFLQEAPAMGNTKDGWNMECLLQKMDDDEFISFEDFSTLCKTYRQ